MRFATPALAALAGCSFAGVRAPPRSIDPATAAPGSFKCNDSSLLPSIDALGGAGAISVMGGGIILEQTTERARYDHFTLYYAGPLLALAIGYWWSASFGNDRITRCSELKERASRVRPVVLPVGDPSKPQESDTEKIEIR